MLFCWVALTLKRKPLFSCFGGPGSALLRPLFQVWIQGVFFIVFSVILYDLDFGLPFGSFWALFSCGFCVVFRIGGKVASGVPKEALLCDFRYNFGGF